MIREDEVLPDEQRLKPKMESVRVSEASRRDARPKTSYNESILSERDQLTLRKRELEDRLRDYSAAKFQKKHMDLERKGPLGRREWIEWKNVAEEERRRLIGDLRKVEERITDLNAKRRVALSGTHTPSDQKMTVWVAILAELREMKLMLGTIVATRRGEGER